MKREEILDAAKRCVCGDREQDYGNPENNFRRIADFWQDYLGYPVTPTDVAAMLALLKIARIATGHAKKDNWIDLAGYAALGGETTSPLDVAIKNKGFKAYRSPSFCTAGLKTEPVSRWLMDKCGKDNRPRIFSEDCFEPEPMTNAQRIRAMSDEELALELALIAEWDRKEFAKAKKCPGLVQFMREWLQKTTEV